MVYHGPIVDAHHHLWPYGRGRHPWLLKAARPMGDREALRCDYLTEDYLADAAGAVVVATIHIEASWTGGPEGEETAWLDATDRSCVAVRHVFHVDLDAPDAAERIAAEAAHPRAAGLRHIVAWHHDPRLSFAARPGLMSDPDWRRGLRAVADAELVFDLMLFPHQMEEAEGLLKAFPDLRVVLDHCGSPADRSDAGMSTWAEGLRRLAERENLILKLSNPVAYDRDWTIESLARVIDHGLDCFGPGRTMWGSDFPVAGLHASFRDLLDAFRAILARRSVIEQQAFFHDTAAAVYRVPMQGAVP